MYRKIILISIIFLLGACSSSKTAKRNAAQMAAAPAWVKERPMSSMYYIGVAKVSKLTYPDSYQEVGKKVALNDLASEISVNIQSNSLVSSYEDNAGFQSEFTRFIQMEMTKDLAGYQMQGTFETDEQYMVYYRLSKAKWAEIQAERKKAAADRAKTMFNQGAKEEGELNYLTAIKSYLNALLELKKYWNEPVYYKVNEEQKRLDLDIRTALTDILASIKLSVRPTNLKLNYKNGFKDILSVAVVNEKGEMLKNFPVKINYRKVSIPYQTTLFTGSDYKQVEIASVKYKPNDLFVIAEIEKDKVLQIKSEDRKLLKFISDAFQANPVKLRIDYTLPTIYISTNNESSPNLHYLKDAIQQSLGKQYFIIANDPKDADLLFKLKVHESAPPSTTKVMSVLLSYSIQVLEKTKHTIIYTYSSDKYKGVDYSLASAREKSYIKAADDINDSSFKNLLQTISD